MLEEGGGVLQSDEEAFEWFSKAAEKRVAKSQNWLGAMYETGRDVVRSDEETAKWSRNAAEKGMHFA